MDNKDEGTSKAEISSTADKKKKTLLVDLGSVRADTRGSAGGAGDSPSAGNDSPHPPHPAMKFTE
jgi:hypothetical protein